MKCLIVLSIALLAGVTSLHAAAIPFKKPVQSASSESRPLVRKVLDALISLAVRMRPQEPPPKVAVAGSKGFTKTDRHEVSAFRLGQAMAVMRYAEGLEQYELVLESGMIVRQELETVLNKRVAAGGALELQAAVDAGLEPALMPHYELGTWVVALRIPLREAVRAGTEPVPSELASYLTGNNLSGLFSGSVRPPIPEVLARLERLSVYTNKSTISLYDAERALKDLDAIIAVYR